MVGCRLRCVLASKIPCPKGSSRCRVLSVVCGPHMIFAVLEMRLWDGIFLGFALTAALMYICLHRDFNNGKLVRFYFRLDFIFFSCKTFILLANINFEAFSLVPNCEIYIWVENIREQKALHSQRGKTDPFFEQFTKTFRRPGMNANAKVNWTVVYKSVSIDDRNR